MKKAFFADMGGFLLQSPDAPLLPLNAQQLLYLVKNGYIPYPEYDEAEVDDKNKYDGLARYDNLVMAFRLLLSSHY